MAKLLGYWTSNLVILSSSPALGPPAGFEPGSPWFNSLAALVYSQLVCLLPLGILNLFHSFVVQFHLLNFLPTMKTTGLTSNCVSC